MIFKILAALFAFLTISGSFMLWAYPETPGHVLSYKDIFVFGVGVALSYFMIWIMKKTEASIEQNRKDCQKKL